MWWKNPKIDLSVSVCSLCLQGFGNCTVTFTSLRTLIKIVFALNLCTINQQWLFERNLDDCSHLNESVAIQSVNGMFSQSKYDQTCDSPAVWENGNKTIFSGVLLCITTNVLLTRCFYSLRWIKKNTEKEVRVFPWGLSCVILFFLH